MEEPPGRKWPRPEFLGWAISRFGELDRDARGGDPPQRGAVGAPVGPRLQKSGPIIARVSEWALQHQFSKC